MSVNKRLTEAARRGAEGKTLPNYMQLTSDQQRDVLNYVMAQPGLVIEIVRASLDAAHPEELEDLLNEMGSTPERKLHTGD